MRHRPPCTCGGFSLLWKLRSIVRDGRTAGCCAARPCYLRSHFRTTPPLPCSVLRCPAAAVDHGSSHRRCWLDEVIPSLPPLPRLEGHPFVPAETCLNPTPKLVDEMPQQASIQQMLHIMLTYTFD